MSSETNKAAAATPPALLRFLARPVGPLASEKAEGFQTFRHHVKNLGNLVHEELKAACEKGALPKRTLVAHLVEVAGPLARRGVKFEIPMLVRSDQWPRIKRAYVHAIAFNFGGTTSFHRRAHTILKGKQGVIGRLTSQTTNYRVPSTLAATAHFVVSWQGTDLAATEPAVATAPAWHSVMPVDEITKLRHKTQLKTEDATVLDAAMLAYDGSTEPNLEALGNNVAGDKGYIKNMAPLVGLADVVLATPVVIKGEDFSHVGLTVVLDSKEPATTAELDAIYLVACRLQELVVISRAHMEAELERQRTLWLAACFAETVARCTSLIKAAKTPAERQAAGRAMHWVEELTAARTNQIGAAAPPPWHKAGWDREDLTITIREGRPAGAAWDVAGLHKTPASPALLTFLDGMFEKVNGLAGRAGATLRATEREENGSIFVEMVFSAALRGKEAWHDLDSFVDDIGNQLWTFEPWDALNRAGLVHPDHGKSVLQVTECDRVKTVHWDHMPIEVSPLAPGTDPKPRMTWSFSGIVAFRP